MAFDVEGARKAGYSESEIVDFLGQQNNFDVSGARKAGYDNSELLSHLVSAKPKKEEKKEFIMKCVKEGCRGFLSQAYKCELCSTYVCKDCMIEKKEKVLLADEFLRKEMYLK